MSWTLFLQVVILFVLGWIMTSTTAGFIIDKLKRRRENG